MTVYKLHGPDRSASPDIAWANVLDGRVFRFRVRYIERYDAWDLSLSTASGDVVIDAIRVSEGTDLIGGITDPRLPGGSLMCIDGAGGGISPGRNDWRERHYLRYEPASTAAVDNELTSTRLFWGEV